MGAINKMDEKIVRLDIKLRQNKEGQQVTFSFGVYLQNSQFYYYDETLIKG